MGQGSLNKDFSLTHEWTPDHAEYLDDFMDQVVEKQTVKVSGEYVGSGVEKTVNVPGLPGQPILAALQPAAGGNTSITLVPFAAGPITAWDRHGFTLLAGHILNTAGTRYRYFILA